MNAPAFRSDRRVGGPVLLALLIVLVGATSLSAQFTEGLGPMPFPPENPPTPEKEILGKILFWEEQLSSDNSTSCGTCHIPEFGGGDPRVFDGIARHPGPDGQYFTDDDIIGSVGLPRQDCDVNGTLVNDPVFGHARQLTGRKAPTMIGAGYAPDVFWDGRATSEFRDPITDAVVIVSGGGLESQAVGPPLSTIEMGCDTRTWADIIAKLGVVTPLALARDIPQSMQDAIAGPDGLFRTTDDLGYPDLFFEAFTTSEITPVRIAFAIASYERTLVPNRTPFDLFLGYPNAVPPEPPVLDALTPDQQQGMLLVIDQCTPCHDTIELSDNSFRNIGVRPSGEDIGRQEVTGDPLDAGKFKVPGLRNVKLRAPYFHNGGKATLDDVLAFYNVGGDFSDNLDPDMVELNLPNSSLVLIKDFLENGLTDPRVENGDEPFDHPKMQTFFLRGDSNFDGGIDIADAIHMLSIIFPSGPPPTPLCGDATDANDDGGIDIADPISVLNWLFSVGTAAPSMALQPVGVFGPDSFNAPDFLGCLD